MANTLFQSLNSSVGRKYVMAISGLALVIFIIMHLVGNLTLLDPTGESFNRYAKGLHDFGWLMIVGEFAIAGIFIIHIAMALGLTLNYKAARPESYSKLQSKGGPSKSTVASRNMIVTGGVLFAFLILHVWQFRFGPGVDQGYIVNLNDHEARDLFRLVAETFSNPLYVAIYVLTMVFLGFHLRHGFWSMFQSLGVMYPRWSSAIYCTALVFAILMSVGFIILPVYLLLQAGAIP